jgi:hypothetical protein
VLGRWFKPVRAVLATPALSSSRLLSPSSSSSSSSAWSASSSSSAWSASSKQLSPRRFFAGSSSGSGGTDSDGQQERFKLLQARVEKAERDKDKAERNMDDAKRELDEAKAAKASKEDIQRAQNNVESARSAWQATVEAHKTAMEAETAARAANRGGAASGAQVVPFAFKPDVLERLKRPLSEWKAGETFDVVGFGVAIGADHCHDVVFLRAEGLAVLRAWESKTPFLAVYGTPGIGKSTLLQLAAMRALVLGNPVLLHVRGENTLIELVDDTTLRVDDLVSLKQLDGKSRPSKKNTVMCYDSRRGFQETVGHANVFKKTLIVHSPSGDLTNTLKAKKILPRFFAVPTEAELVELGALESIEVDEVRRRVARYGPIIRYVINTVVAETSIDAGISTMVDAGVEGLSNLGRASRDVHRIMLMVPKPTQVGVMLVFASDYVRDEVLRRMSVSHATALLRLANTVDIHGSLRGQVFENRMLDTLGRVAEITFITDGGNKVLQIAGNGVTLCKADGALTLPAGDLQHHVVYRPPHSNNASWDALVVESDQVAYLLQMTVASAHAVKQHGLAAGKSLLAKAGFRGEVRLVFLLPPAAFSDFRVPQAILTADGKAVAASTANEWPQEKWCVDKVDGGTLWPQQQKE